MGKQYQIRNGVVTEITPQVAAIVGRNVGELVHSIVPLVDANLHLLDGTQLQDDGIYADGIAKIKALQTSYPNLFISEADWQDSVTNYGICGKFVIGTGTLRLPKITGFMEGTIDSTALGDLVEAGLPEITGTINPLTLMTATGYESAPIGGASGAFVLNDNASTRRYYSSAGTTTSTYSTGIKFVASNSNAIYGNSTTVQPQSIKGFIYIVLGTFPKSSAVVNLDNVATDLNGKTDVDITNLTNAGKAALAHAAMPSKTTKALANPTSTGYTWTMDADGYFTGFAMSTAAAGYIQVLRNSLTSAISIAPTSGFGLSVEIPVSAGDVVKLNYRGVDSFAFTFTYCNGTAHLAS